MMFANESTIRDAARSLSRNGDTFTVGQVIRRLGTWGYAIRAVDVGLRIEEVLTSNDAYCTDEAGTFAAL